MTLRIENNIVNDKTGQPEKVQAQQAQKPDVIPVGQKEESKPDTEKPVEGYYVEKTTQTPEDDDDKLDTSINPDARITLKNPSIAIYKETNEVTDAMKRTVDRAVASTFETSGADGYFKAEDMMEDYQEYDCFDGINYTKKLNVYGKAVYEGSNVLLTSNVPSKIKRTENSVKADFGLNYKNKSETTKAMLFSSLTKSSANIHVNSISSNDGEVQEEELDLDSNYKSYSLYGAAQHRLKNKDLGTLSAYHIYDETQDARTSNVTASYFFNKYTALAKGNLNIYKVLNQKAITKLDFNISFNPELAYSEDKADETMQPETESAAETEFVQQTNSKKWSKSFSPFFDTQAINGSTEEGLGGQMLFKRIGSDSALRIGGFGKVSTTQQEDDSRYHVTFGSSLKYKKNLNSKSQLAANVDLKNRVTFGHENITTADAAVSYTSPVITAEVEGKYINITKPNSLSYAGVVGRLFYTQNKNVNWFAEGCWTKMKEPNYTTSCYNVQVGVVLNCELFGK